MNDADVSKGTSNDKRNTMTVRKALPKDVMDVFRWRNDSYVCTMSRHSEPINEATHIVWYSKAISDPYRLLLIGVIENQRIGFVRFDCNHVSLWEASIVLAPEARGRGLSKQFLKMALGRLQSDHAQVAVLAVVNLHNKPSLRLFYSLGFVQKGNGSGFIHLILPPNHG